MKAIRKCGPLTKIFLCIVVAAVILAIVHSFTETPIKEALDILGKTSDWTSKREPQTLTFLYKGRPVVSIDKDRGLDLGSYASKGQFYSHIDDDYIHTPPGRGDQGEDGLRGPRGYNGRQGPSGQAIEGRVGPAGERGSTGPRGPAGAVGETGAVGAKGAVGAPSYTYLFDGCPRGGRASSWKMVQNPTTFEKCKQTCSDDPRCNAIEINGCNSLGTAYPKKGDKPSNCNARCYNFYGTGTGFTGPGCVRSGDQKAYKKN